MKIIKQSFLIIFTLIEAFIFSQTNVSIKVATLSYQFTETQPNILETKLSENGKLSLEPGLLFSYEAYASSNTAIKLSQSLILDKALHLSGNTQLMIKFRIVKAFKHSLYFAIGPAFHYRKTWSDMENYIDEPIYNGSDNWQHKISWLSGEIEYNLYLNKFTDLSISLNHTQAESMGLAVGFKYWINKKPRNKRGCVACPGLH